MTAPALSVRGLSVSMPSADGHVRIVDAVDLDLMPGQAVGLVGESGCGKTLLARALMGLLDHVGARVTCDSMELAGRATMPGAPQPGGGGLAMIFQEPSRALDPVFTIGWQLSRAAMRRLGAGRREAREIALQALTEVGFKDPVTVYSARPGELSGGMRQLVMIAMASAVKPAVLIADEPTTSLDVTTQLGVLGRLAGLRDTLGTALLVISHDLGVVANSCSEALVMYAGRIVERSPYAELYRQPQHPYTAGLLAAVPRLSPGIARPIAGPVPLPGQWPPGCRFNTRCSWATGDCVTQAPALQECAGRAVACHHPR